VVGLDELVVIVGEV